MSELSRYPLVWPLGWRRTESYRRKYGHFKVARRDISIASAVERIRHELKLLDQIGDNELLISTNVRTRLDGLPRSDQAEPQDPGAAVYWQVGKNRRCMAVDIYTTVADNLAAIAATLEAMRAIERHGGAAILDRAFSGFTALPAPEQWFQVLGVGANATRQEIEAAHRRLAMDHHPDREGGTDAQMARINVALDEGLASRE